MFRSLVSWISLNVDNILNAKAGFVLYCFTGDLARLINHYGYLDLLRFLPCSKFFKIRCMTLSRPKSTLYDIIIVIAERKDFANLLQRWLKHRPN